MENMVIGLAKEITEGEKRVLLTPDEVKIIVDIGYQVYVEKDAGIKADFNNHQYSDAGAIIVDKLTLWNQCDVIIKFKCPQKCEYPLLHQGQIIGAFMHAEGNPKLVDILCKNKITAYSFEFFKTNDNLFPMSFIDSEIAGKLAMIYGMYHLQSHLNGEGILLSPVVGVELPKIVVIGYGNAGNASIRMAEALGLDVTVFGTNREKLRKFQATVSPNVHCHLYSKDMFEKAIIEADLVIGAIQISTYDTPAIIAEDLVKKMKKGSMIIDITCGYGKGYLPSFNKLTSFDNPVYERFGVLHCKIDLLPAAVPKTTTKAVSKHILPYLLNWFHAIKTGDFDAISNNGLITKDGNIMHKELQRHIAFFQSK